MWEGNQICFSEEPGRPSEVWGGHAWLPLKRYFQFAEDSLVPFWRVQEAFWSMVRLWVTSCTSECLPAVTAFLVISGTWVKSSSEPAGEAPLYSSLMASNILSKNCQCKGSIDMKRKGNLSCKNQGKMNRATFFSLVPKGKPLVHHHESSTSRIKIEKLYLGWDPVPKGKSNLPREGTPEGTL